MTMSCPWQRAHTAETGRVVCSFEGPLIIWFSLGTSQENGKRIILTLKAFTAVALTTGSVSGIIQDSLAFWVVANQHVLRAPGCQFSLSRLTCAYEISALLHSSVSKKKGHLKLEHRGIKICPPSAHSYFYQQAVEQSKFITQAKWAVLSSEVIFNFTGEMWGTLYPILPWLFV